MEALVIPAATGLSPRPAVPPDGVWIFAEQRGGVLAPVTAELLGEGRRLAAELQVPVAAVLFGADVAKLSPALLAAGAHKVYLAEHPRLQDFLEETYAAALTALPGSIGRKSSWPGPPMPAGPSSPGWPPASRPA